MKKTLFRFVNTVIQSKLENEIIWSHIITLRFKYLKKNMSHECDNFIPEDSRYYNFGKLLEKIIVYVETFILRYC